MIEMVDQNDRKTNTFIFFRIFSKTNKLGRIDRFICKAAKEVFNSRYLTIFHEQMKFFLLLRTKRKISIFQQLKGKLAL